MELDFTDLALLIGTNPLPNYIASKYFIEENKHLKKIWLVCSEENLNINQNSTGKYALNLKELLSKEEAPPDYINDTQKIEFPEIIYIEDIGSKKMIEKQLEKIVKDSNNRKLHLFFTGGSKAMSAYSYSYLKEKFKNKFSASYLSARDFKIMFDDEDNITKNIADKIKINFNDLIKLHGFEKRDTKKQNDISIEFEKFIDKIIEKFRIIIKNEKLDEFYSNSGGYNRNIFKPDVNDKIMEKIFSSITKEDSKILKAATSDKCLEEEENKIKTDDDKLKFNKKVNIFKKILNYNPNETFMEVIGSFPEDYKIYRYNNSNKPNFQTKIGYEKYKRAVDFLDGLWLEQYVGKIIKKYFENDFDEILFNQKPYRNSDDPSNNFELDVVLIKGCQLIGISCTTAECKDLCKKKGFEIILRTRQIGGTETKAILITRADEKIVEKLKTELVLETGTVKTNITVIGKNGWEESKLKEKIKEFILN
ncbi:MAG: hypothetical protein ACYCSW_02620 [bacterium]